MSAEPAESSRRSSPETRHSSDEPPANLGANQPLAKVHASPGIQRDRYPFEYQKARAEHGELRQHWLSISTSCGKKAVKTRIAFGLPAAHAAFPLRNPPERRIVLLGRADSVCPLNSPI